MINDDNKKSKAKLIAELQELRRQNQDYKARMVNQPVIGLHTEMMMKKLITHSPISIQVLDKIGGLISVNDAHTRLFQALPPPDYNLFTDKILLEQDLDDSFRRLKRGEVVFFPDTWYNAHLYDPAFQDKKVWVKTCGISVPDTDGQPQFFIIMHEDISERILNGYELNELNSRLQSMAARIQDSVEKEKSYIAYELHDQVGQYLTGIKYELFSVIMKMPEDENVLKIKNIIVSIKELLVRVQNLTATIRPVVLSGMGMKANIDWYIHEFEQQTKIKVLTDIDYSISLSDDNALIIYRILQESLTNIGRHSKANRADIIVKKVDETFNLTISDNGIGITDEQIHAHKSYGIFFMKERIKSIGGSFSISSKKDAGTQIDISIPLKQQKS
jgi:signal transduction histidine kinase